MKYFVVVCYELIFRLIFSLTELLFESLESVSTSSIRVCIRCEAEIIYQPLPEDDPRRRQPDISKAQRVLGWQPQVDLETGLTATLDFFRKQTVVPAVC